MQDFKHLYNVEPKLSTWTMIKEGLAFAAFIFAAFAFFLALSAI